MKPYTLHLPPGYRPPPLPGRNEWAEDLRINTDKQCTGRLGMPDGPNCCLGRLSLLQGRLTPEGFDGTLWGPVAGTALGEDNPMDPVLSKMGAFPDKVSVRVDPDPHLDALTCLAECNDNGLNFDQIADIIEAVWSDGGPLPKEAT